MCEPSSSKSFTTQYQQRISCRIYIYMKCSDGGYFDVSQVNIGEFLKKVFTVATICRQHLPNKIPMKQLTQEQWREYNNSTNCLICAKPFLSADKKVHDHNHLAGEYSGATHNAWNLNYRTHAVFCLISKLFTLAKLIFNNTSCLWIFLTSCE